MRRFAIPITTLALSLSGLVFSPAQANVPADGWYDCATGQPGGAPGEGYYQITSGEVFNNTARNCTGAVLIPEGVTGFGFRAFNFATRVTSVNIPASVTTIGEGAFRNVGLPSITIPATVRSIGIGAFSEAAQLTTVTFAPGSQITSIPDSAFSQTLKLSSITIPDSVTRIGNSAFSNTQGLTSITIPANVTSIGSNAFFDSQVLTTVTFAPGSKLTSIGQDAFRLARSLISINIPASVTTIGDGAFAIYNPFFAPPSVSLTAITVEPANQNFTAIDGVLFDKNVTTLIQYPAKKSGTYSIPTSVTSIGSEAFAQAIGLTSITIPAGVTVIKNRTFSGASELASVSLPESVISIESEAFRQTSLTSITIPAGVTVIRNNTFSGASKLASVSLPAGVTSIESEAFRGATALTSINIPEGVTAIAAYTFYENTSLNSINLPSTLTSIGDEAFYKTGLTSITIPANVTNIGTRAFSTSQALTAVTFESGSKLASIGERAFVDVNKLTQIKIPASVTSIGVSAFQGATVLADVFFSGITAPTVGANAFTGVASLAKANIKSGAELAFPATGSPARWRGLAVSVGFYDSVSFDTKGGSTVATRDYAPSITEPTAPTRPGYAFVGWTATDGGETTVTFPYAPSETSSITLYAKWTVGTYTVTYDSKGGTAVSNGSFTTGGDFAAPTAPTRAGYTFAGWTATDGGSTTVSFPYAPGVIEGITLYAKWSLDTYTVSYNSKGGTAVSNGSFSVITDVSQPTAPTRAGYTLAGWTATDGGSAIVTFPYAPSETSGITLYAKWTANINTVTYNSKGGTAVTSGSFTTGGDFAAPTAPTRAGYTFVGWTTTDGGSAIVSFPYAPSATSDITLYAKWAPITYAVTYVSNGGTAVASGSFTVVNNMARPTAPTREDYSFVGWTEVDGGETTVTFPYAPSVTSDITLYAKWLSVPPFKPIRNSSPTISGNARQNTLLESTSGTWLATPAAVVTVQWYRCDKNVAAGQATISDAMDCKKIAGATKFKYKVVLADQGMRITVLTEAKNKMGSTFATAKSMLVPMATEPVMKSAPKISGRIAKGKIVTLGTGTWSANPTPTARMQWYRCDKPVTRGISEFKKSMDCVKISGATKALYKIVVADQAKYLTALVTSKNSQGELVKSAKSVKVPGTKPELRTSPKISGSANVGGTLRATDGSWSGIPEADTSVAWYRCSKAVSAGATSITSKMGCKKISGATSSRYTVKTADEGKYLTVLVKAKNEAGNASATAKSIYVKVPVVTP